MTFVKLSYFNEGNFSKTRLMNNLSTEENQNQYSCVHSLAQGTNRVLLCHGSHYVMMRGSLAIRGGGDLCLCWLGLVFVGFVPYHVDKGIVKTTSNGNRAWVVHFRT
jgi:hypothetical protein